MERNFRAAAGLLVLALVVPILSQYSSANTGNSGNAEARRAASAPEAVALNLGDKAPDFTLPDQNGKTVSLSQFQGKALDPTGAHDACSLMAHRRAEREKKE